MAPQSNELAFYLLKRRLPASESPHVLGRVISHYQDPTFDYTPHSPSTSLTIPVFNQFLLGAQHDDSAHFTSQACRNDKLWAKVTGLLSTSSTSAEAGSTEVVSPRITTRRLKRVDDYFDALKHVPEARRKLLDMCPIGGTVHLVVGTMSTQTATFRLAASRSRNVKTSGSLPTDLAATGAAASVGLPLPPELVPKPEAGAHRSDYLESTMNFSATAAGENGEVDEAAEEVFAIACKAITRDWAGLGSDLRIKAKRPEYRGGQHFGAGDDFDSDEDEDGTADSDEAEEDLAARGLHLEATQFKTSDDVVFAPLPESLLEEE